MTRRQGDKRGQDSIYNCVVTLGKRRDIFQTLPVTGQGRLDWPVTGRKVYRAREERTATGQQPVGDPDTLEEVTQGDMVITIHGDPRTKKNSQRIIRVGGFPRIAPSRQYLEYEQMALRQLALTKPDEPLAGPVNIAVLYFMKTRRRVDLANLLEATDDILTRAGYIQDDNAQVIAGHDGSRVLYDKDDPRAEIFITPFGE